MAKLGYTIDVSNAAQRTEFGALPAGEYIAQVDECELAVTKRGDGKYLKLTFTILDGELAGRKCFENMNVENPNKKTVDFAQTALRELLEACHLPPAMDDTSIVVGIPIKLKVGMGKPRDDGSPQNTIRFKPLNGGTTTPAFLAPGGSSSGSAPLADNAPKKKPWEK